MVSKAPRMISVVTGSAVFRDLARTGRGREGARRAGGAMTWRDTETAGGDKGGGGGGTAGGRRHDVEVHRDVGSGQGAVRSAARASGGARRHHDGHAPRRRE